MKKTLLLLGATALGISTLSVQAATEQLYCTLEYMPVCGTVVENGKSVQKTFGNRCEAGVAKAVNVVEGECANASLESPQKIVEWAYDAKLTRFDKAAAFGYDRAMSRQEAAAFAVRAGQYIFSKDYNKAVDSCRVNFTDKKDIDSNLDVDVKASCGMGLFLGNNGNFYPKHSLTHAEALMVLVRMIDGKTYANLAAYTTRANELGLTFANLHEFNTPITRGTFVEWIRTAHISTDKKPVTQTPIMNDKNLIGTWKLTDVSTLTGTEKSEVAKLGVSATFDVTRITSKICNQINGEYTATGGKISAPNMISTMMLCSGVVQKVEDAFNPHGASYAIALSGSLSTLKITTAKWVVFTFEKTEVATAVDTSTLLGNWTLATYNTLDRTAVKKSGYDKTTLVLEKDKFSAKFCNNMSGSYGFSGNTLTSGGVAMTKMACADTTLMQMESGFDLAGATYEHHMVADTTTKGGMEHILTLKTKAGNSYTFVKSIK